MATEMWTFRTKRFAVKWTIEEQYGYQYDGDDDGSTQAALNDGSMVAFDSIMDVYLDGVLLASDFLGGSVYYAGQEASFRDHIGMNARGHGSYFSDMVREAIREARAVLCKAPRVRCAA
jgi:hypothetical protein